MVAPAMTPVEDEFDLDALYDLLDQTKQGSPESKRISLQIVKAIGHTSTADPVPDRK